MSLLRQIEDEAAQALRADARLGLFPIRVYTRQAEEAVPWRQLPHGLLLLPPALYLTDREQPMPLTVGIQFSLLVFVRHQGAAPPGASWEDGAAGLAEHAVVVLHGRAHTQGGEFRAERLAVQPLGRAELSLMWDEAYPRGFHRRMLMPPADRFLDACFAHFCTTATLSGGD